MGHLRRQANLFRRLVRGEKMGQPSPDMLKGKELRQGVCWIDSSLIGANRDQETASLGRRRYGGVQVQERMNSGMEAIFEGIWRPKTRRSAGIARMNGVKTSHTSSRNPGINTLKHRRTTKAEELGLATRPDSP
jgi:hypothetical protein